MVDQQHIQAAQSGLCMLASIKKWINANYGMLAVSGGDKPKLMVVYAILLAVLLALNGSPTNKRQHKF